MESTLNEQLLKEMEAHSVCWEIIPASVQNLLQTVSQSYGQFEQMHQALEHSMEVSAQELEANSQQLASQAQLQRTNKELEEFVYVASHDLREPLRSIKSFSQILSMKLDKELDQDSLEMFRFITEGVKRMEILLNDLLEFAKIGNQDQQLSYIDLNEVLNVVLKNLSVRIEENEAQIIADHLPTIKASPTRMQQLLQNLIGNAIKFRGKQAPIVQIKTIRDEQFHTISIQDNGIGIDQAYKTKVFKVFQRLNSRNAYDGSGIGLSICQKIIAQLNGQIWLESEPGEGTTFFFTIPVLTEEMVA